MFLKKIHRAFKPVY
jgi:hypothetical protein